MSDRFSGRLLNVLLGRNNPVLALYPVQNYAAGAGAVVPGVTLTAGVAWAAWPGTDIIAAAAIITDFWLTQIMYDTCTLAATFDIQIYNVTTAAIVYEDKNELTATTSSLPPTCFKYPIYCPPNSRISGRVGGTNTKAINVSLLVATGL
jgi:hypothetical protein